MTPNNARFAKFVGYPMVALTLLAFLNGGKEPTATATTVTPSVATGDSKLRDTDLRAAAEAFRLRPQDFAVGSIAGGLSVFLSRCRSTHPELSPAAVAVINDASAAINQRYDTRDMTRLTSDILLGEFREIGADRWCKAFKKLIEEAKR